MPSVKEDQWQSPCHDEPGTPVPGAGGVLEEGRVTRASRRALLYPGRGQKMHPSTHLGCSQILERKEFTYNQDE